MPGAGYIAMVPHDYAKAVTIEEIRAALAGRGFSPKRAARIKDKLRVVVEGGLFPGYSEAADDVSFIYHCLIPRKYKLGSWTTHYKENDDVIYFLSHKKMQSLLKNPSFSQAGTETDTSETDSSETESSDTSEDEGNHSVPERSVTKHKQANKKGHSSTSKAQGAVTKTVSTVKEKAHKSNRADKHPTKEKHHEKEKHHKPGAIPTKQSVPTTTSSKPEHVVIKKKDKISPEEPELPIKRPSNKSDKTKAKAPAPKHSRHSQDWPFT
ncbi:hypothetical protein Pelo_13343 [Pelomyxa schiedti]|nr:hypothetical protein Pelo_13343 [Pelomyxa schiedti]